MHGWDDGEGTTEPDIPPKVVISQHDPDPYFTRFLMPYKLNRNPGVDTLHVEFPHEECQTDDAEGMQVVDDETAAALITIGEARACEHCKPFAEAS